MFVGIVQCSYQTFLRGIALSCRYARIPACTHILARICATKQFRSKSFSRTLELSQCNATNTPTNFEPKRLKPKLDNVEKPENRVHKLTDSLSNWGTSDLAGSLTRPSRLYFKSFRLLTARLLLAPCPYITLSFVITCRA